MSFDPDAYALAFDPDKYASKTTAGQMAGDIALDVGPGIVGQAIGSAPPLVAATYGLSIPVGGAIGGATGNILRQRREMKRGEREKFSYGQLSIETGLSAVNFGKLAKGGSLLAGAGKRTVQGAGLGLGAAATESLLDEGSLPSLGDMFTRTVGGGAFGGILGAGEQKISNALAKKLPKGLKEIEAIFAPAEKVSVWQKMKEAPKTLQQELVNQYAPLARLEDGVFKAGGLQRVGLDLARKFEQVAGAAGKAEGAIIRFNRAVGDQIVGQESEFNIYLFLKRAEDRLKTDAIGRKVGDWDLPMVQQKLTELTTHLGPQEQARFDKVAVQYQAMMDDALQLQVKSGRMSQEVYDAIKDKNDFYAPFRVMKYLIEAEKLGGTGRKIDTKAELTKAISGVEQEDLKLQDILVSSRENIFKSRILADKNLKMQELAGLTKYDPKGEFVRYDAANVDVPKGKEKVYVWENGQQAALIVDTDVAKAVSGLNSTQTGVVLKTLALGAVPFRVGATSANAAFQLVNALLADLPTFALTSKYGLFESGKAGNALFDTLRMPLDYAYGLGTSLTGNFGHPNPLYMRWLDSGAARSTIQSTLKSMSEKGGISPTMGKMPEGFIDTMGAFANAIEETAKITGLKRAIRMDGFDKLPAGAQARMMEEIVTEIRNYAGSPDFPRLGLASANANIILLFFNARVQGVARTYGRLSGADGGARAAKTWGKLAGTIGTAAVGLHMLNQAPENKADYERINEVERQNNFMVPRYNADGSGKYFKNDEGEQVRDYWKLPKREDVKLFANMTESFLSFAQQNDPKAVTDFGVSFLENIAPVSISGDNFEERIQSVISSTNPLIKAPINLGLGKNTFYHRDTVPARLKGGIGGMTPELHFKDSTPELFKQAAVSMPDFLPERLRNPLYLEQLTQDLSAGLVTQFTTSKPLEGRDAAATNVVGRRFTRSQYLDTSKETDLIKTLDRASTDKRVTEQRTARDFLDALPNLNPQQKQEAAVKILQGDPKLIDRLNEELKARAYNWTGLERQIGGLGVKDGSRAKYIAEQMKPMNPQQRLQYLANLYQKTLFTSDDASFLPMLLP